MASPQKHKQKYESNKQILDKLLREKRKPNDWLVTIAFYSALHLVDKTIVESSGEAHKPMDHTDRDLKVTRLTELKHIRTYYKALYMASRKSRYECVSITDKERENNLQYLSEIEKELNK